MVKNNQSKIKLLALRVVESIYEEDNKKPKAGKFLYREKANLTITIEEMEFLKSELSNKYSTPLHFIHCDFEIIEN